ncbi:helix-turn-helix domain-containing protein [Bartonella sp. LJL80]
MNKIDPIDAAVGAALAEIRINKGESCEDLAQIIAQTLEQITLFEMGAIRIDATLLQRIAEHYDTGVSTFFKKTPGYENLDTGGMIELFRAYNSMSPELQQKLLTIPKNMVSN